MNECNVTRHKGKTDIRARNAWNFRDCTFNYADGKFSRLSTSCLTLDRAAVMWLASMYWYHLYCTFVRSMRNKLYRRLSVYHSLTIIITIRHYKLIWLVHNEVRLHKYIPVPIQFARVARGILDSDLSILNDGRMLNGGYTLAQYCRCTGMSRGSTLPSFMPETKRRSCPPSSASRVLGSPAPLLNVNFWFWDI